MTESEYKRREDTFKKIVDEMYDLYVKKNRDYGGSVTDTYEKFGLTSFLVRLSDKLNRITNLTINNKENLVKDEKIQDTLLDLANYAILALIELKEDENKLCHEISSATDYQDSFSNIDKYLAAKHSKKE